MVSSMSNNQGIRNPSNGLNVLTINCWGIPFAPNRKDRMMAIGKKIASGKYDIIGLQEIWFDQDWDTICRYAKNEEMIYTSRFPSGVIGSGLGVISTHKIYDSNFKPFAVNGFPQNVHHGDYYGGKGIGLARIDTPLGLVDFYTTHLIARYSHKDQYLSHRIAQSIEVVKYIEETRKNDLAILTGDLNADSQTIEYKIVNGIGMFIDSYYMFSPADPGYTDNELNTYNSTGRNRRIDFIFVRTSKGKNVKIVNSELDLKVVEELGYSYSDHFGVHTAVELYDSNTLIDDQPDNKINNDLKNLKQRAIELIDDGIENAIYRRKFHTNKLIAGVISIFAGKIIARDILRPSILSKLIDLTATYVSPLFSFAQLIFANISTNEEINGLRLVKIYLENLSNPLEE